MTETSGGNAGSHDCFVHSPTPMMVFDLSEGTGECGTPLDANQEAADLFNAESGSQLKTGFGELVPRKILPELRRMRESLEAGDRTFSLQGDFRTFSGRETRLMLQYRSLPGYEQSLKRVLLSFTDVSEILRLREENRFLSELPASNPNIMLVMECFGEILYMNPSAEKWLKDRALTEKSEIRRLFPQEFQASVCASCGKKHMQNRRIEEDGRIYDFKSTPLFGTDRCMMTITDVTDIVRISRERELYETSLHSLRQALLITDNKGKILFVNPEFERLYGYTSKDLKGLKPDVLNPGKNYYFNIGVPEEEYNRKFADLWRVISDPEIACWSGEIPNQKKDGTVIWVELLINAIFDRDGKVSHYISIAHDISHRKSEELHNQLEMFRTLTDMAELRDNETGNHILRVGQFCRRTAEKIGMPYSYCEDIERFAPMHDIGKVGIPDRILLAERKLTPEEFEEMKTHTTKGFDLLKDRELMTMAAEIAGSHHEKYDGSGYPEGLKSREIPLSARITAIADVYDALRSRRPYKEPWTHEEAIAELKKLSGSQFDPDCLDAFLSINEQIRTISEYLQD